MDTVSTQIKKGKGGDGFLNKYRWLFLIYIFVVLCVYFKIFLLKGSLSGGDWGIADNVDQAKVFLNSLVHTWTRTSNIFGTRQLSMPLMIVIAPSILVSYLGISFATIFKILLLFTLAFAASNFNLFLRYIGLKRVPSLVGGAVFIFSPVFFNYSLMGWLFVLVSLALIPLFVYLVLRSIDENNYKFALLASLIFSVAAIQSQSIVWFALILVFAIIGYGVLSKKILISIKMGAIITLSYLLINLYWLAGFVLFPDLNVTGSELVKSTISAGTSDNLNLFNILKLWGGLFNNQFETSYPNTLSFVPYIIPTMVLISLAFWKKFGRHLIYLILIFLVIVVFYFMGRGSLSNLPYANLIRDISRFTTISTFALVAMFSIALNQVYLHKSVYRYLLLVPIFVLLILNVYPYYSGALFSGQGLDHDFRFRSRVWPIEYSEINDKLSSEPQDARALYLPMGGMLSISDDKEFKGSFMEAQDVYSGFSPIPSMISISDRSKGASGDLITQIDESIKAMDSSRLQESLSEAKIDYLIVRQDVDMYDWGGVEKEKFRLLLFGIIKRGEAELYYEDDPIYALKFASGKRTLDMIGGDNASFSYKKINSAVYEIGIKNLENEAIINFYENFDPYWEIVDSRGTVSNKIVSDEDHFINHGYANGFRVKPENLNNDMGKIYLVYKPERFQTLWFVISIFSIFSIAVLLFRKKSKLVT